MRKKDKGFAMVFTLVVIMLLVVLSTVVVSLSTASYVNSIQTEKNNKLKLAAESGIDRAQVALKSYIKTNPNVIVEPDKFDPSLVIVPILNENGITTTVTVSPSGTIGTTADSLTGRNINYIKIHCVAQENNTNKSRSVDAIIDKGSVSNVYFDRLFKSSFTVAPIVNSNSQTSFTVYSNTNLDMSGNMFLQADNFQFQPSSGGSVGTFGMDEGDIYYKTKSNNNQINFNLEPISKAGNTINLFKDDGDYIKAPWQNISIKPINLLGILAQSPNNSADDMQGFLDPLNDTIDVSTIREKQFIDNVGNEYPITLVTYKAKTYNSVVNINFQKIVDGHNTFINDPKDTSKKPKQIPDGIYSYIINDVLPEYSGSINNYLDYFGHMYKLLLIDGNLDIEDDLTENFNNYVIYCTGTVTFKGNANFFNSSIFAKSIVFPDASVGNKSITFYGVGTAKAATHKIGGFPLDDFQDYDKQIINRYLVSNLDGYGDFMQFKTLSWKEY